MRKALSAQETGRSDREDSVIIRGPLANPAFRAQFSGHETFPLRHLWLKKAYDQVAAAEDGIV